MKAAAKKIKTRNNLNAPQLYLMCAIPLALIFVFCYLPMFGIVIAFENYNFAGGLFGSPWVGFKNFEFFLKSNDFLQVTWNTLSLNFIFIVIGTVAAVALAILLYEISNRFVVKAAQTIYITPYFLSWVVAGYMAYAILHPEHGSLNRMLVFFGGEKINWYAAPSPWTSILSVASVWKNTGMDMVIYYAALMAIDTDLFEAATLDGASRMKIIRYIIIPELVSLVSILTILKIGNIFRADFGLFYQLTRDMGQLYSTTDVIDTYLYRSMRNSYDFGISAAIGLLQSVVGFVLVVATNFAANKISPENALF